MNSLEARLRRLFVATAIASTVLVSSASLGVAADATALREPAKAIFGALPENAASAERPMTPARVDLGRKLYYDARLSKNQDVACNSCHRLHAFGVDGEPTSAGDKGQRGGRNSPTVYNAALHIAQFWDGRAADVEAQAKGPILNPIEMAMASEASTVAVLRSIPGYAPLFAAAFPGQKEPLGYDNMAIAIGAFERGLLTPSPFDRFLAGDDAALDGDALEGLSLFIQKGCIACHNGPVIGGSEYRKIGLVKPYPTEDAGRFDVTGEESDRHVFKVPSLPTSQRLAPTSTTAALRASMRSCV